MTHPDGAYLPSIKERSPSADAERLRNSVADWSAALAAVSDLPSAVRQDVVDALELAQRFNAEVVRPWALQIDRQAMDDPAYIPRELIRQAGDWGLFTLWVPVLFGGKGWNYLSLYAFLEEVASACAGVCGRVVHDWRALHGAGRPDGRLEPAPGREDLGRSVRGRAPW